MLRVQKEDGLFHYQYDLQGLRYDDTQDNIVRQTDGAYGLAQAATYLNEEKYFEGTFNAIRGLIRSSETYTREDAAARFIPFAGESRNNTNALLILAILEAGKRRPAAYQEYQAILKELAQHIIFSQNQDGSFYNRYDGVTSKFNNAGDYHYNNGESFLALVELNAIFSDASYEDAISKASERLIDLYGDKWDRSFYMWGIKGFTQLYAQKPDPRYRNIVFQMTDRMLKNDLFWERANRISMAVYLEGLIPAYMLAKSSWPAKDAVDEERSMRYGAAARKALRALRNLQITSSDGLLASTFHIAKGGFCESLACKYLRIDNNQHGIGAFIAAGMDRALWQ